MKLDEAERVAIEVNLRCRSCDAWNMPGRKPTIELAGNGWAECTTCNQRWYMKRDANNRRRP